MPIKERRIVATDDNGRKCRLLVRDEYIVHPSAAQVEAFVATRVFDEDGNELRPEGKGRYRSALTGLGYTSNDPNAPGDGADP
jgi:hypothetical protein